MMQIYLDSNATSPMEDEVSDTVIFYMTKEFGNSGSRTHEYGIAAKRAVEEARRWVAAVVDVDVGGVIFTSGATESNNLAILGLKAEGERSNRKHLIIGATEHKAVLEPAEHLQALGFELTVLMPGNDGFVDPEDLAKAVRDDTLLVSLMHVNNETGIIQPLENYAEVLKGHACYFHTDAAQGFGKDIERLRNPRIDLISASGHKIYGPKGIGALIARRRNYKMPPLQPLMYGGGQERGLRPGTLPVPLIAGLGKAAELALDGHLTRNAYNLKIKQAAISSLASLAPAYHGSSENTAPHVLNFSIPGVNSEAALIALKNVAAVSNGSACTSASYTPSHVLTAMGLSDDEAEGALRVSWSHMTQEVDWAEFTNALSDLA